MGCSKMAAQIGILLRNRPQQTKAKSYLKKISKVIIKSLQPGEGDGANYLYPFGGVLYELGKFGNEGRGFHDHRIFLRNLWAVLKIILEQRNLLAELRQEGVDEIKPGNARSQPFDWQSVYMCATERKLPGEL